MDDDEPAAPQVGKAEPGNDDPHEPHPAAWLYLPDLTAQTGWASHRVPKGDALPRERRRVGFRPDK